MTTRPEDITPDTPDRRVSRSILAALEQKRVTRMDLQRRIYAGDGWLSTRVCGRTRWTVDDVARVAVALQIDPAGIVAGNERWDR